MPHLVDTYNKLIYLSPFFGASPVKSRAQWCEPVESRTTVKNKSDIAKYETCDTFTSAQNWMHLSG